MFRRTYEEIIEMLIQTVITPAVARAIVRKSGWRPVAGQGDLGGLIPPGGAPGDVLWYDFDSTTFNSDPALWQPMWVKPEYLEYIESGGAQALAQPYLGDERGIPLFTFGTRNPDYTQTGDDNRLGLQTAAWDALSRNEMLVWEDIPSGNWHYPFNVDWFVTKRELNARPNQYLPRQIKMRGSVLEGAPAADLEFKYSTDASTWTTLVSIDLASGGPVNSGWMAFNEAAASDVYLGLFLNARSSISRLHMGPIEVLMRWGPRGTLLPEEFLP